MSNSLRVSVCSNCGHSLVRASSCSGNPTRNRTFQYESRPNIFWGSLFNFGKKKKDTHVKTQVSEESRKRAEEVARQFREARDQAGRPPAASRPPPAGQSPSTNQDKPIYASSQKEGYSFLKDVFGSRLTPQSPSKSTFTPSGQAYPKPKRPSKYDHKILQQPEYTSQNPFLAPLRAEQNEALRKYLAMSRSITASSRSKDLS